MNFTRLFRMVLICCSASYALLVAAQSTEPANGMDTFSPYTPAQIKQFNQQTVSPEQGPFGPINPNESAPQEPRFDSQYFNVTVGQQEAEAIETQSVEPYEPIPTTIRF
jgi:hypothetical protein